MLALHTYSPFYSARVCRCGDFSQIAVYIHIWLFVVLPLHAISFCNDIMDVLNVAYQTIMSEMCVCLCAFFLKGIMQ